MLFRSINKDGVRDAQDLIDPNNPDSLPIASVGFDGLPSEALDIGNKLFFDLGDGRGPGDPNDPNNKNLEAFKYSLTGLQTWHEIKN